MRYHIEASFEMDGHRVDCSTYEVLGGAYGALYDTMDEAKKVCDDLQDDVEFYELLESTEYSVWKGNLQIYIAKGSE
jgi:hypothetical protein